MITPWAHALKNYEATDLAMRLGTSTVRNASNYGGSKPSDVAVCYKPSQVEEALDFRPWRLVICGDERNFTGLSGAYETPDEYAVRWRHALIQLENANVRFATKGLGMINGKFDSEYHDRLISLTTAPVRAVNCTPWDWPNARRAIEANGGRWSVTVIPYRANWHPWEHNTVLAWARQELFRPFVRALVEASGHPNVVNVGVWCLKENYLGEPHNTWQDWHGLFDRHGRETWQARVVRDIAK